MGSGCDVRSQPKTIEVRDPLNTRSIPQRGGAAGASSPLRGSRPAPSSTTTTRPSPVVTRDGAPQSQHAASTRNATLMASRLLEVARRTRSRMSILDALAELETAEPCSMGAPTAKDESAIVSIAVASEYQGLAMKRYVDIAKAIETIEEGQTIHLAHHGGFSCDQVLIRLAEIIGPAHFRAATWILSRIPAMHMVRAAQSGAYLSCKFMLDVRALLFQQVAVDILHESFGFDAVRFREIHAKAYWLENDTASISMIGSANLTENPRLEIFTITRSRQVGDFWRDWFDSQWKISKPFQTYRAKKAETDTTRTLVILRGLPGSGKTTWSDLNLPDATVASRGPFLTNPLTGKFEWTADAEIAYRRHRAKLVRSHVFKKTMATVVMDDVHARLSSFKADIDLARASHITVRVIRFDTPIEVCLASQTHNVPEEVVRKMAADFEDYPGEEIIKHVDR